MIDVSVVTPTTGRWHELERAMRSVQAQTGVRAEHIVVGDDVAPQAWRRGADRMRSLWPEAILVNLPCHADVAAYGPARTARLRNCGVAQARGTYVAHLDDDNEYEPDHLRSLLATLRSSGGRVAYSWRQLLRPDGSPYVVAGRNPWFREPEAARRSYVELREADVFQDGSNEMRDRPIGPAGEGYYLVDSSELLVQREYNRRTPFRTLYTDDERKQNLCEDRAFCMDVYAAGDEMVPSRSATLRYFMGGYSNAAAGAHIE